MTAQKMAARETIYMDVNSQFHPVVPRSLYALFNLCSKYRLILLGSLAENFRIIFPDFTRDVAWLYEILDYLTFPKLRGLLDLLYN